MTSRDHTALDMAPFDGHHAQDINPPRADHDPSAPPKILDQCQQLATALGDDISLSPQHQDDPEELNFE